MTLDETDDAPFHLVRQGLLNYYRTRYAFMVDILKDLASKGIHTATITVPGGCFLVIASWPSRASDEYPDVLDSRFLERILNPSGFGNPVVFGQRSTKVHFPV